MLNKKQAKDVYDNKKQPPGLFAVFYQILSEITCPLNKLEDLIEQIIYIINNCKSIVFHSKAGVLYEYLPLGESKDALKYVYNIVKEVEDSLDTKYLFPLASTSDIPMEGVYNKIVKEAQRPLKNKAETLAKEMLDFHKKVLKSEDNKFRIVDKLSSEFHIKLLKATSEIIKIDASPVLDAHTFKFKSKLNEWRKEQLKILVDKLTKMIPKENYYYAYNGGKFNKISSKTGKQQAKELAEKIIDLIYNKRLNIFNKFKKQPWGGQIGNMLGGWFKVKGEMECADWTGLFYKGLEDNLKKYYKINLNSFRVEWRRIAPWLYNHFEHNYIRILGPNKSKYLVIDPWGSGGVKIIPKKEKTGSFPWQGNYLYNDGDIIYAYPKVDKF